MCPSRVVFVLFVLVVGCHGMDVSPSAGAQPAADPYNPYAVLVYDYLESDGAFPLSVLLEWIEGFQRKLGVKRRNMIVVTPRASVVAKGQDLQTALPGITAGNYLANGGLCDVLNIVQGGKVEGVKRQIKPDATHVYLLVAMHGFSGDARKKRVTAKDAFDPTGGSAFARRNAADADTCPPEAEQMVQNIPSFGWLLGGPLYRWMAEKQPSDRKFVVFVDSCMSASFFNNVVQRVDEHSGMAATDKLAQAKVAQYNPKLQLARTLIITSAADNCATDGSHFTSVVKAAFHVSRAERETWGWLLEQVKLESQRGWSRGQMAAPLADQQIAWALRKEGDTRPAYKATTRAFQVRAFGDPHMLSELVRPDKQSNHGGTLPWFANELQNGRVPGVRVERDKGLPMPTKPENKNEPLPPPPSSSSSSSPSPPSPLSPSPRPSSPRPSSSSSSSLSSSSFTLFYGTKIHCTGDGDGEPFMVGDFQEKGDFGVVYSLVGDYAAVFFTDKRIKQQLETANAMLPGLAVCWGSISSPAPLDFMVMRAEMPCMRPLTEADFKRLFQELKWCVRGGHRHAPLHPQMSTTVFSLDQIMCRGDVPTIISFGRSEPSKGLQEEVRDLIHNVMARQEYTPKGSSKLVDGDTFHQEFMKRWQPLQSLPLEPDALFELGLKVVTEVKAYLDRSKRHK